MSADQFAVQNSILSFWRDAGPKKWWKKDSAFDQEISEKFRDLHQQASKGDLDTWAETAEGALALILLLDQFSRNLFRNDARAFAQDAHCREIVRMAMTNGLDRTMPDDIGQFCYLPLMHSESLADQKLCLQEMERLGEKESIRSALQHLEIIEKFGRFPHRNGVMGRTTSSEEQSFLDDGGFSG